jgi:CubicO group peptidase (beta-lactamase class C family)
VGRALGCIVLLSAVACADRPPVGPIVGDATIDVTVVGLPAGAIANVTVDGNGSSRIVTGTMSVPLSAGIYTISAGSLQHGVTTWYPNLASRSVEVGSGQRWPIRIRYGKLPVSGAHQPGLDLFDSAMVAFMAARHIGAGTVSISRAGNTLYRRAFGWRDSARTEWLAPNALMRLASNSKPVTAAAIRRLVSQGLLTLDTKAFTLLGLSPAGPVADPRIYDITIQHLLDHTGGWNRNVAGDFMFKSREISRALGIASPPTKTQIAQWVMTQPLQNKPGATSSYSNFGFLVLGLIVEKVTGQGFIDYARQSFFAGQSANEIVSGHSLRGERDAREPFYSDPYKGCSVFNVETCVLVPWPDGGWYLEAFDACGGLVASAPAMVSFLDAYWINGQPRLAGAAASYTFYGSLDGTFTMMRQRMDGTNIVVLFNQRTDASGLPYQQIQEVLDAVSDRVFGVATSVVDRRY